MRLLLAGLQRLTSCHHPLAATKPCWLNAQWSKPVGKTTPVLFRENFCWRHNRRLYSTGDRFHTRYRRNYRLSRTNIALYQAHHRVWFGKIRQNVANDSVLSARQPEAMVRPGGSKERRAPRSEEPHASAAAEKLTKRLQTKVEINRRGKGGTLRLHFHSEEELMRL